MHSASPCSAGACRALDAASASAQEVSADASARLGRPTSAEVRVCVDGRVLSRLLGSCSSSGGTSVTVRAGRDRDGSGGIRASARVPGVASADVSLGTGRSRPDTTASGQASATPARAATVDGAAADTSPRAEADATANLSEPLLDLRLFDSRPLASFAGIGLLESSPFAVDGDPATDSLLAIGDLLPESLTGQAPAGIGVLETSPIASGNQVDTGSGSISPSAPVTVCGSSVAAQGDASASCGADTSTGGIIAPPPATDPDGTFDTGTSGIPGTVGLTSGTGGGSGDPITTFAPLRSPTSGSGALPFTSAGSDLLTTLAGGLLAVGALVVRATRPDAKRKGGGDR